MFRKICSYDPLFLQKVAIMTPFLRHVASSQQFWDERSKKKIVWRPKSQLLKS